MECSYGSRGENQRDAKRLSSEERSLVRYHVAGRTCYCRGFVAAHRMLLRETKKAYDQEVIKFLYRYSPAFVNHLYRDTGINRKAVFPAYDCSCIYVS
jgi:hypothetical protein